MPCSEFMRGKGTRAGKCSGESTAALEMAGVMSGVSSGRCAIGIAERVKTTRYSAFGSIFWYQQFSFYPVITSKRRNI